MRDIVLFKISTILDIWCRVHSSLLPLLVHQALVFPRRPILLIYTRKYEIALQEDSSHHRSTIRNNRTFGLNTNKVCAGREFDKSSSFNSSSL